MRVLFDTDVVLDLLLDRQPFATPATKLFCLVEAGEISGHVCATTVTTVHYLAAKAVGKQRAIKQIERLLALCEVAPVNRSVLEVAMAAKFSDFEDAVLSASAGQVDAQVIATRNTRDFKKSRVPAREPAELLSMLEAGEG